MGRVCPLSTCMFLAPTMVRLAGCSRLFGAGNRVVRGCLLAEKSILFYSMLLRVRCGRSTCRTTRWSLNKKFQNEPEKLFSPYSQLRTPLRFQLLYLTQPQSARRRTLKACLKVASVYLAFNSIRSPPN